MVVVAVKIDIRVDIGKCWQMHPTQLNNVYLHLLQHNNNYDNKLKRFICRCSVEGQEGGCVGEGSLVVHSLTRSEIKYLNWHFGLKLIMDNFSCLK